MDLDDESVSLESEELEPTDVSETWKERRTRELGFKPQYEELHNFHLPYVSQLDDESAKLLDDIKNELGKTLALREINPGVGVCVFNLAK